MIKRRIYWFIENPVTLALVLYALNSGNPGWERVALLVVWAGLLISFFLCPIVLAVALCKPDAFDKDSRPVCAPRWLTVGFDSAKIVTLAFHGHMWTAGFLVAASVLEQVTVSLLIAALELKEEKGAA